MHGRSQLNPAYKGIACAPRTPVTFVWEFRPYVDYSGKVFAETKQKMVKLVSGSIYLRLFQAYSMRQWPCCRVPDLHSEGCGFESQPGYFAGRSTQSSIPPGSVNEFHLRLGRQRQVLVIPIADEHVGVQVKLRCLENTWHN